MEQSWKMLYGISLWVLLVAVPLVNCKPVNTAQPPTPAPADNDPNAQQNKGTGLEYDRYLQQVVEVLESDDEFRKKLENSNISDIKSGAIAMHLQLVNKTVRTRLDEIKRIEIQRLQQLARLRSRMSSDGMNHQAHLEIPSHLDIRNPHSFEIKDLENLILKTTRDLEDVDEQRRKDFKEYEMEKEYEYQQKLNNLPEEERQRVQQKHEELQQKHKEHEKIQHPGSKDQFEEVWEKEDKMTDQDFNPKTFFMMHDLNEDRFWDIQEVEAVLQRELEKVYDPNNSPEEDDPVEEKEDMNRMREHVFTAMDVDKDLMISMQEFLQYTGLFGENKRFEENEGWKTVDEKPAFTDEEYQQYVEQHHPQPGVVPAPVDSNLEFKPEDQQHLQQQQQQDQNAQQGMPQAMPHEVPVQNMQQQQQGEHGEVGQQGVAQQGAPAQDTVREEPIHQEDVAMQLNVVNHDQPMENQLHQGQGEPLHGQPQGQPIQNQVHAGQGQPVQGQAAP